MLGRQSREGLGGSSAPGAAAETSTQGTTGNYFEQVPAVEGGWRVMNEREVIGNPGAKCRQRSCQGVCVTAKILASTSERTIDLVALSVYWGVITCPPRQSSDADFRGTGPSYYILHGVLS